MNEYDPSLIDAYWQRFLDSLPSSAERPAAYAADAFGDSPKLADELAVLVVEGKKTATCGDLWSYQTEGVPFPYVGGWWIVLDGRGQPVAVTETTEVELRRYNEVDARFAFDEGEGDRSLAYWREAHRSYFSRMLPSIGREFAEDMPLVCERFRVAYR